GGRRRASLRLRVLLARDDVAALPRDAGLVGGLLRRLTLGDTRGRRRRLEHGGGGGEDVGAIERVAVLPRVVVVMDLMHPADVSQRILRVLRPHIAPMRAEGVLVG